MKVKRIAWLITSSIAVFSLCLSIAKPVLGDATTGGSKSGRSPVPGQQTGGALNFWKGIDATDNPCTSSTSFVDMPGMVLTFNAAGRVVANFQGEWISGSSGNRALLRLVIDGVVQNGPGNASSPFSPHEGSGVSTNGFTFISNTLSLGSHTAKIQWATTSGTACVDERSFVIFHK